MANDRFPVQGATDDARTAEAEAAFATRIESAANEGEIMDAVTDLFRSGGYDFDTKHVPAEAEASIKKKLGALFPTRESFDRAYDSIRGSMGGKMEAVSSAHIPWLHDEKYKGMPSDEAFREMEKDRDQAVTHRKRELSALIGAEVFLVTMLGSLLEKSK